MRQDWPDIPYPAWKDTCSALHLYAQIIGKYRIAHTPWINHSWHATLYPCAAGLTTGLVMDGRLGVELTLDLVGHRVEGTASNGRRGQFPLEPMSVADFHRQVIDLVSGLGGTARFNGAPNEIADAVPFARDHAPRPYDADAVRRFHAALLLSAAVLGRFRTGFLGKSSPVHFFWGSFDLAVTRFSGRVAPRHRGGIPALPDGITREAYSHEVSSAGFWPGGGGLDHPAFYSYAYPAPSDFDRARVEPDEARFDGRLGEFVLPYDAVRTAPDPEATLMHFLQSTYRAAADLGAWDGDLECAIGEPRRPRHVA